MKGHRGIAGRSGAGALALGVGLLLGAGAAGAADLARVREKAIELEQKLNRHRYEVEVRGDRSNVERIYKDYAFLLKKERVDDAASESAGDPRAERLRQYLIEAIVGSGLAPYHDELRNQLNTSTVDVDGELLGYSNLLARLARAGDDAQRRKLYTGLKPLVETANVFRNQIAQRTVEGYQAWGYADFADFYARREQVDLQKLGADAQAFLTASQALYDTLFSRFALHTLGVEARKVRFSDLPYLLEGEEFKDLLPPESRTARAEGIFRGLGVDLGGLKGLALDFKERAGRPLGAGVYPLVVPAEVAAGFLPTGGPADEDLALQIRSEALHDALSRATGFEAAYLVPRAPQAAMTYLLRSIRDEPAWMSRNLQLGDRAGAYRTFRAFSLLMEARMMAATVLYETALYRADVEAENVFKERMREATGIRLSSTDAARGLEFASEMASAAHFEGLLLAARLRSAAHAKAGETWFEDPATGAAFRAWWELGGDLTTAALTRDLPADGGVEALLDLITSRLQP